MVAPRVKALCIVLVFTLQRVTNIPVVYWRVLLRRADFRQNALFICVRHLWVNRQVIFAFSWEHSDPGPRWSLMIWNVEGLRPSKNPLNHTKASLEKLPHVVVPWMVKWRHLLSLPAGNLCRNTFRHPQQDWSEKKSRFMFSFTRRRAKFLYSADVSYENERWKVLIHLRSPSYACCKLAEVLTGL